jgi:hypothetical protein
VIWSSENYQKEMNQAIDKRANAQIAGVNAGAGQARAGVEQNYQLELGANNRFTSVRSMLPAKFALRDWMLRNYDRPQPLSPRSDERSRGKLVKE